MEPRHDDRFDDWLRALDARHYADLTFPEVSRALRALSSAYVERRRCLSSGAALAGAGKRAAFALFYGPLHYVLVREILAVLPRARSHGSGVLVDLGCGTGSSGAAWASSQSATPRVIGIDRHPWALAEAAWTYRTLGIEAKTRLGDLSDQALPKSAADFVAAFTINELPAAARDSLLTQFLDRARRGDRVLVVEPLAGFVAPWWPGWRKAFVAAGGRADEWRIRIALPAGVAKLDRAAGLDHRELTGRSLWLG